jgi:(S)-3,5-dihydroxyphenylglycine transaminase
MDLPFRFDAKAAVEGARDYGVIILPVSFFAPDDSQDRRIRFSFSAPDHEQIRRGVISLFGDGAAAVALVALGADEVSDGHH